MALVASNFMLEDYLKSRDQFNMHRELLFTTSTTKVVIGASHAAHGLVPQEPFVNLSNAGNPAYFFREMVHQLKQTRRLTDVIIQADANMFRADGEEPAAGKSDFQRYLVPPPAYPVLDGRYRSALPQLWREYLFSDPKIRFHSSGWQELTEPGWETKSAQERLSLAKKAVDRHVPAPDYRDRSTLKLYTDLIDELKQDGTKVCMVAFPKSEEYLRYRDEIPLFAQAAADLKAISEKHGVTFLDLTHHFQGRPDLFWDPDHLTPQGARLLSDYIFTHCGS